MGSSFPRGLVVQGLALTFLAVNLRGSQPAIDRGSAPGAIAAAPSSAAIRVFRASCLQCHDGDGRGEVGRDASPTIPNFTDAKWQASRSDAELTHSILEGKGKSMPKMKNKLGSVPAKEMVAFVRAFRGGKQVVEDEPEVPSPPEQPRVATESTGSGPRPAASPTPDPNASSLREGSRLFRRSCAACHGADGKGSGMRDSLPTIPDFTVHTWQEKRNDPQLIVSVLDGKEAGMPPFRDKVAREQVRDLVAFIRSFDPTPRKTTQTGSDDFEIRFRKLTDEFGRSQPAEPSASHHRPRPARRQALPIRPRFAADPAFGREPNWARRGDCRKEIGLNCGIVSGASPAGGSLWLDPSHPRRSSRVCRHAQYAGLGGWGRATASPQAPRVCATPTTALDSVPSLRCQEVSRVHAGSSAPADFYTSRGDESRSGTLPSEPSAPRLTSACPSTASRPGSTLASPSNPSDDGSGTDCEEQDFADPYHARAIGHVGEELGVQIGIRPLRERRTFDGEDAEQSGRVRRGQEIHLQQVGPRRPRHGHP